MGGMAVIIIVTLAVLTIIAVAVLRAQGEKTTAPTDEKDRIRRVKAKLTRDELSRLGVEISQMAEKNTKSINFYVEDGSQSYILEFRRR